MDQKILFKQMIDMQKVAFDNSFKVMTTIREQGEKMANMVLEEASWLPEEGKKAMTDWIGTYKKGYDNFRDAVAENFNKMQDCFVVSESKPEDGAATNLKRNDKQTPPESKDLKQNDKQTPPASKDLKQNDKQTPPASKDLKEDDKQTQPASKDLKQNDKQTPSLASEKA